MIQVQQNIPKIAINEEIPWTPKATPLLETQIKSSGLSKKSFTIIAIVILIIIIVGVVAGNLISNAVSKSCMLFEFNDSTFVYRQQIR